MNIIEAGSKQSKTKAIKDLRGRIDAIRKDLKKLDCHGALTRLAVDCRAYDTIEARHAFLSAPYEARKGEPAFLTGKPRYAALAALHALNRGQQKLNRPLKDVVKTPGKRSEDEDDLFVVRAVDAVKAFTVKPTEVREHFTLILYACKDADESRVGSLASEMQSATLAPRAGVFKQREKTSDRYLVCGLESVEKAADHTLVSGALHI